MQASMNASKHACKQACMQASMHASKHAGHAGRICMERERKLESERQRRERERERDRDRERERDRQTQTHRHTHPILRAKAVEQADHIRFRPEPNVRSCLRPSSAALGSSACGFKGFATTGSHTGSSTSARPRSRTTKKPPGRPHEAFHQGKFKLAGAAHLETA